MRNEDLDYLSRDAQEMFAKSFNERVQQIKDDIGQIEGVMTMLQAFDKSGYISSKYGADLHRRSAARIICPPLFSLTLMADGHVNASEYRTARAVLEKFGLADHIEECFSLSEEEAEEALTEILNDAIGVMRSNPGNFMVTQTVSDLPKRIYRIILYLMGCDDEFGEKETKILCGAIGWLEGCGAKLW